METVRARGGEEREGERELEMERGELEREEKRESGRRDI